MYTRWTAHLNTQEEKDNFKRQVYSAKPVLERLMEVVKEDEGLLDRSEMHSEAYAKPNWDYHQAHKNGRRQYMNEVKNLVNLDQQKGSINDPR